MKTRIISSLSLLLLLLAACAPAAPAEPAAEQQQPVAAASTPTAFQPSDTGVSAPVATDVVTAPTEAAAPAPVATSRGDGLQATNPSTVSLASGGLQLVEFFRFT